MGKIEHGSAAPLDTPFVMGGETFRSRLLVGTGKYRDFAQTRDAIEASGAQIVTVAIRRTNIGQEPGQPNLLDALDPHRFTILPNTAGCCRGGAHPAHGTGAAGRA
jgi:thiazole synthase